MPDRTTNFTITATNSAGSSVQTVVFICKPPVEMITICHTEAGAVPQTISIPANEWSTHAGHGDVRGPCPVIVKPVVSITSPLSGQVALENCVASIRATVDNITDKRNISITLNGSLVDFDFTGNSLTLSNVPFTGTANFIITARNSAGSSSQSVTFLCQPPIEMIAICHSEEGASPQNINIPVTDWPAHASHGDSRGECPVVERPVVTITSPSTSPVTLENCVASIRVLVENITEKQNISVTQNGSPVTFGFSGNTVTVSNITFEGTANFVITATNSAGSATQTASFVCQPPVEMINICHTDPGAAPQTISIPATEWPTHAGHGDTQGECPVIEAPGVRVISPRSSPVTLENCVASIRATIDNVAEKQNITVTQNGSPVTFGFSGNTVTVSNISFEGTANFVITATNSAGSSSQTVTFVCQPKETEIAICHYPPGNTNNPQTITIPESAWSAHEGHGDSRGECPVILAPELTINSPSSASVSVEDCKASINATVRNIDNKENITVTQNGTPVSFNYSGNSLRISNITFTGTVTFTISVSNSSGSDSKTVSFICSQEEPDDEPEEEEQQNKITICHIPPGNKSNPQTISIPESAWPAHEKHGDSRGACDND